MSAKEIIIRPITRKVANPFVRRVHYSGKIVQNSQINIGVFLHGRLEGVMQFGPSMDKRKLIGLVRDTEWNGFIELNRLAFTDRLPRNSESRALGVVLRQFRKHRPGLEWVISFADATLCGDGTIYRASGFVLSAINKNKSNWRLPLPDDIDKRALAGAGLAPSEIKLLQRWIESLTVDGGAVYSVLALQSSLLPPSATGPCVHKMSIEDYVPARNGSRHLLSVSVRHIMRKVSGGASSASRLFKLMGAAPAVGFQLRYIYFLNPAARDRLTVDLIPFSRIDEMGAGMYRGELRAGSPAV